MNKNVFLFVFVLCKLDDQTRLMLKFEIKEIFIELNDNNNN